MADKDFKTIEEQLEILRSRGLTISDESQAKDFLLRNNYYRISGYSLTLCKPGGCPGSPFSAVPSSVYPKSRP